ncbi:hypothetical protein [Pseudohongiella sp. O18]|uniref:hypothetical protein n=1 Tax=Pseudohongiella sp. O18 TaxID=2904248 RepID=UPI001F2FD700|nr:hypothetical protein [Pseudohongiella sp. O18]
MQDELNLIILQNRVIIFLLAFLCVRALICNLIAYHDRKRAKSVRDDEFGLSALWDKDLLDDLIRKSRHLHSRYPNRVDAIFFQAKALRKLGRDLESRDLWEKLKKIDPSFEEECDRQINDINQKQVTNEKKQTDA